MLCQPRHLGAVTLAAVLTLPVAGTAPAGTPAAAPHTCSVQQLALSWAGGTAKHGGTGNQDTAIVRVHNKGDKSCTLHGYPNVTLKAKAAHDTETLRHTPRTKPRTVTIAPGTHTTFTLVFLSELNEPAQAIKPNRVDITLPGNSRSTSLDWPWGPVTRQEGATHPGNYVGALGSPLKP
ncbi:MULTISPECIES: DUF4232 domain-containing protein [unclassified Streptomyces]|uniref:DUF4232 domain-containing protein n=1 Tax=unclassified Streptomyces TaxID=2593676 RepID=UPI0003721891|nr:MULTISPECIES: DUF4232 domain-containing protein [unclassified Streptomyces]MYT30871.1 DUF4232 domain-containing protein [Streptomyces sp. SID8354]